MQVTEVKRKNEWERSLKLYDIKQVEMVDDIESLLSYSRKRILKWYKKKRKKALLV